MSCTPRLTQMLRERGYRMTSQRFAILQVLPPYAIGSVAMFWVIQRLAAF